MKKETIIERLNRLKHEDISSLSDDELRDILKRSTKEARTRVTLLKKAGFEDKYTRGDITLKGEKEIVKRKSLEAELKRQTEFLTSPKSTVKGFKHETEIKRLRLLQQTDMIPKTSDYMEQKGYKGLKGLKRAESELLAESYKRYPDLTPNSLKETFDMYDKIKELDPTLTKDTLGSDRLIREIKNIAVDQPSDYGDFREYLKRNYPNLTRREIDEIMRNDIYKNNKTMGVLYASLKSAYKDVLDSDEDIWRRRRMDDRNI